MRPPKELEDRTAQYQRSERSSALKKDLTGPTWLEMSDLAYQAVESVLLARIDVRIRARGSSQKK